MRLIDADALREKAQWMEMSDNQGINFDVRAVSVSSIDLAPTIEAEPMRHGYWIEGRDGSCMCSECGKVSRYEIGYYCSKCGAKMDLPN